MDTAQMENTHPSDQTTWLPHTPPSTAKSGRHTKPSTVDKSMHDLQHDQSKSDPESSWWCPDAMMMPEEYLPVTKEQEICRRVRHGLLLHPGGSNLYIMPTHFESPDCKEIQNLRDKISLSGGMFVRDVFDAKLILTKVTHEKRARLDLRTCGVFTEVEESEDECFWKVTMGPSTITVVNLDWMWDSWRAGHMLPMDEYVVHHGRILRKVRPSTESK